MATTLDAVLRIVAKADATALGAVQRGITGIKNAADSANRSMSGLTGVLGGLSGGMAALGAGLSAAGLAAFAKQTIDAADNLRDMSLTTGVSVESLSKFQQAANMSGATIEDVGKSMVRLQRSMVTAASTGTGPAAEAFRDLGVSVTDATGKLRPVEQVMLDIFEAISQVPDRSIRAKLAIDLLGRSGANLVPMMEEGRAGIEGLNAAFSTEFANNADRYNDSIAGLGVIATQLGTAITNELLPGMIQAVEWTAKLGIVIRDYFIENKDGILQVANAFVELWKTIALGGVFLRPILEQWVGSSQKAEQEFAKVRDSIMGARIAQAALTPEVKGTSAAVEETKRKQEEHKRLVEATKREQAAFKAEIQQTKAQYDLLGASIDATSQAIEGQGRVRAATLTADIAINDAAKATLEAKLGQAQTDQEKIPILMQIRAIEVENARLQKLAADAQIDAEIQIAELKRKKAEAERQAAEEMLRTAQLYRQETGQLQEQVNLKTLGVRSAALDLQLQRQIAQQRRRANEANYQAQLARINGVPLPGALGGMGLAPGQWVNPTTGQIMGRQTPAIAAGQGPALYASGGYVTGPQLAWVGEGGQSEYVIPSSKMAAASASYLAGARGAAVLTGGGGAGGPISVNIKTGPVMQSGGQDWVTRADMTRAVSEAVRQTRRALLSPGGRAELGMA